MKRTHIFAKSRGTVRLQLEHGRVVELPIFQGILKHPNLDTLPGLLEDPQVARIYTAEALRKAAWPLLREFPRGWLRECLSQTHDVRPGRLKALEHLMS